MVTNCETYHTAVHIPKMRTIPRVLCPDQECSPKGSKLPGTCEIRKFVCGRKQLIETPEGKNEKPEYNKNIKRVEGTAAHLSSYVAKT